MGAKRPVLLIDGESRGDIGVIRSLGSGGIPVHLLGANPRSPSAASRYVTHVHPFPGLGASEDACLAAVQTAARACDQRPVMLATGDRAVAFMSRWREELAAFVDHDLAPAPLIQTCFEKDRFAPVAKDLGLPVPETFVPSSAAEARALVDRLPWPVFVKPVYRSDWERLPREIVTSVKGQRCDSEAAFLRLIDALETQGPSRFVIQRFVEGGDHEHVDVHVYRLPDGTVLGTFTGSKLRIYPAYAGVGAQVLSRRVPELEAVSHQVLGALGYTGFANLNYKRDARRGVYELLEINCRYSTWTELPSRAGCNFPLAAYAAIVGHPLPRLEQSEGISWLDFERDVASMVTYRAAGEWTWGAYLRSLATVRCWAYFAWDDPGPFLRKVRTGWTATASNMMHAALPGVGET